MKRGDLLLVGGVLLLALALFASRNLSPGNGERAALLTVDGETVYRFSLSEEEPPFEYSLTGRAGGEIAVRIERRRVRLLRSDCPDGDCVRTGWLERAGDTAVCLPNRLVLKVVGTGDAEFDAVSY